jgi:hypothetical protein
MNDETSGQLTNTWRLPDYAQGHLWVEGVSGAAVAEGEYGLFDLPGPTPYVTVYWGAVDKGSALVCLPWQPDSLEWGGQVGVGGYVDALHFTEIHELDYAINILYVGGQPLRHDLKPHATGADRGEPISAPDFHSGLMSDGRETVTTWLVPDNSPLTAVAQDAMMNNLRLHCFGRLARARSGWNKFFALPIVLEALTVFGP